MSTPPSELKVITECKRLNEYVFHVTEKSPKKYRYSLVDRMDNLCLDIISLLYEANDIKLGEKGRLERQREAQTKLRLLDGGRVDRTLPSSKRKRMRRHIKNIRSDSISSLASYKGYLRRLSEHKLTAEIAGILKKNKTSQTAVNSNETFS